MPNPRHRFPMLAGFVALTCLLAGCGEGSSSSLVQLEGSSASITRGTLNHWMRATVGVDFRASIGTKGPQGLVAEPANYPECMQAAEKIVPRSFSGQLKLTDAQLKLKCQQLHQAIKEEALGFLIQMRWSELEAANAGAKITPAALHAEYEAYLKRTFPAEGQLQKYLAERHWSTADVLFEVKRNLLARVLIPRFQAEVQKAGGGNAVYAALTIAQGHARTAKTHCKAGYVVPGCKGYREPSGGPLAPNVIIEAFAQGRVSSRSPYK